MTSATPTPGTWIAALRSSHHHLRTVVKPLRPEDLRSRGYPSEWSIAQVLSHIGSGAEIMMLTLDAGLAGEEPPSRDAYPSIWDRWNAKSPDEQAADALAADAALVAKIEANAHSTAEFSLFGGVTDIGGLAGARLGEHAMHTWDVAVAVDPRESVRPEAVALLLGRLDGIVGWSAKPSSWTGVVHVLTSDPAREFRLTLGEKSTLEPWTGGPADATLELPAEAFVRLVYGRLDNSHAPPVSATGIGVDDLRTVFRGF